MVVRYSYTDIMVEEVGIVYFFRHKVLPILEVTVPEIAPCVGLSVLQCLYAFKSYAYTYVL